MAWTCLCLLGFLLSGARMQPLLEDTSDTEAISDFFIDLFVENARVGRDLENNEIEQEEIKDKIIEVENTKSNPEEVASYNIYMDAVFRRMNAALRAKLMDPMELNLNKKENTKKDKKVDKDDKKRVERDISETEDEEVVEAVEEEEDLEVDVEDSVDRMGIAQKKKAKQGKKNGNNKAKKGGVKNKKAGDKKKKSKKGGKKEQDPKVKARKQAEREKKRKQKQEIKKRAKEARKAGKLSRNKRNKQSKEAEEKKKNRDNKEKKNKKERRSDQKPNKEGKAIGSLSGIATLRRSGDVTVEEEETHRLVTSVFTVGPLQLEVSKSFGQGQARTVKTAKAATDVMEGVMVLKVKPDGSAHVKKVVFRKPEHVNVQGSISDKKARSKKILLNSLNKSRPLAAQKILQTARFVLKSSSQTTTS